MVNSCLCYIQRSGILTHRTKFKKKNGNPYKDTTKIKLQFTFTGHMTVLQADNSNTAHCPPSSKCHYSHSDP